MSHWTANELRMIDSATELRVTSRRPEGTLGPFVTTWHTTVDDVLYIRSTRAPENGWFRRALRAGIGRIEVGDLTKDVTFERADPAVRHDIDAALHHKYDRFGPGPVGAITGDDVLKTTLKVLPAVPISDTTEDGRALS